MSEEGEREMEYLPTGCVALWAAVFVKGKRMKKKKKARLRLRANELMCVAIIEEDRNVK